MILYSDNLSIQYLSDFNCEGFEERDIEVTFFLSSCVPIMWMLAGG
jgi:hypothetical protein